MPRSGRVKLDLTGLRKFERSLGNGVTFTTGLFDRKNASKGAALEFGTDKQVARPWLSSLFNANSKALKRIVGHLEELVQDALEGRNTKRKIAEKITSEVQTHLLDQEFSADPLTKRTKDLKSKKGSVTPSYIGLDEYDMVAAIKTRSKGGKRTR